MKRFALILAASLCALCAGASTPLKLMSYNIRGTGHAADTLDLAWDARKAPSVKMIRDKRPDVIGFQEPKRDQVLYLVGELKEYDCVAANRNGDAGIEGERIVVMWLRDKYELRRKGQFWLSETPDRVSRGWDGKNRRVTVWVCLREKASGREFYYFATHLDHKGHEARREGALLNVRMMRSIAGKKATVFISGDMNCEKGRKTGEYLEAYTDWMKSAQEQAAQTDDRPSFNAFGRGRMRTLDYIFYRNAVPLRYETVDSEQYGVRYISDHYPIMCEFELK